MSRPMGAHIHVFIVGSQWVDVKHHALLPFQPRPRPQPRSLFSYCSLMPSGFSVRGSMVRVNGYRVHGFSSFRVCWIRNIVSL